MPKINGPATPVRRRRWTAAEKAAYVAEYARSRLSIAAFCREKGLSLGTFARWRQGARTGSAGPGSRPPSTPFGFARVELAPASEPPSAWTRHAAADRAITLVVRGRGGLEAEITGVDAATAARMLRLVLPRVR